LAYISADPYPSGIFRARVKAPKGQARLYGHLICYYSEDGTWYAERDVAWSWRSSGYYHRWHRQRMPEKLTLGPIHEPYAVQCVFQLYASGKGGRLRFQLQRAESDAATWTTIARVTNSGRHATFAHIPFASGARKPVDGGTYRVRVKAPEGRVTLKGSLGCSFSSNDTEHEERDLAWSWRSHGYYYPWHLQRLPVAMTAPAVYCHVRLNARGKGGRLTMQLQQLTG
jgi:hypothetical protein